MHLLALVLVEWTAFDVRAKVEELMYPYYDESRYLSCPALFESDHHRQVCPRCIDNAQRIENLGLRDWTYHDWVFGGNFDGALRGESPERYERHVEALNKLVSVGSEPGTAELGPAFFARFEEMNRDLFEANVIPVRDLPPDLRFSVLMMPYGEWHERKWEEDEQRWRERSRHALALHSDCLAVACDVYVE